MKLTKKLFKLSSNFKLPGEVKMVIIKCSGCGQTISAKNSNCPGCKMETNNQPQKRQLNRIEIGLIVVGVLGSGLVIYTQWGVQTWNAISQEQKVCSTSDGRKVYELFNQVPQEWDDALELAGSTSRMNLPPRIAELQSLRRNIQAQEWPKCAKPGREHLISGMNSMIDGFILFLDSDNPKSLAESEFAMGELEFTLFSLELAKLKSTESK